VAGAGSGRQRLARAPGAARPRHPRHLPAPADHDRGAGQARGVDERHRRGRIGASIVAAVAEGKAPSRRRLPDAVDELDRSKRPAITLVSAWVSQVARDARIDTALLATRADLVALSRRPDARLRPRVARPSCSGTAARLMDGRAA
jgi:ribonuclease D